MGGRAVPLVPLVSELLDSLCRWSLFHPGQLSGTDTREVFGAIGDHWKLVTQMQSWPGLLLPASLAKAATPRMRPEDPWPGFPGCSFPLVPSPMCPNRCLVGGTGCVYTWNVTEIRAEGL